MRGFFRLFVSGSLVLGLAACNRAPAPPDDGRRPVATIKDIMDSIVDPSADFIWQSVATVVTAAGEEDRQPRTDEEWAEVRRHAIRLVEATNLLVMEGRKVANPGQKSENPGIELEPEQMQELIDKDRATFIKLARALQDQAIPALNAVDAKSTQGLIDAGEKIDVACETCHLKYWYPGGGPPPAPVDLKGN